MLALLLSLAASDIVQFDAQCVPGFSDLTYIKNGLKSEFPTMNNPMGPLQTFIYYDKDGNVQTGGMWTIQQITSGDTTQRIAFLKLKDRFDSTNSSIEQEFLIKPITVNTKVCGYTDFMSWMNVLTPILTWDKEKQKYMAHVFYVDRLGKFAYLKIMEGENIVAESSCDKQINNAEYFVQRASNSVDWAWQDFVMHTYIKPGDAHAESKEGFIIFRSQPECIPSKEAAKSLPLVTFDLNTATFSVLFVENFLMRRTKTKDMAQYSFGIDPKTKNIVLITSEPTGSRDEYFYLSIPMNHPIWINSVLNHPPEQKEFSSSYKDLQQKRNKVSYPRIKASSALKAAGNVGWSPVKPQERVFGLYAGYASTRRFPYDTYGPAFVIDNKITITSLYNNGPLDFSNPEIYFINSSKYGIRMIPYSPKETSDVVYQTPYADVLIINAEQFTSQTNVAYASTVNQVASTNLLYFPGPTLLDNNGNPVLNSQMMQFGLGTCAMNKFTLLMKFGAPKITKDQVAYKGYFGQTYPKGKEPAFTIDDQADPPDNYDQVQDIPPVEGDAPTIVFPPIPTSVPVPTPAGKPGDPKHYCICDEDKNKCYNYGCSELDDIYNSNNFYLELQDIIFDETNRNIFIRVSSVSFATDAVQIDQLIFQNVQLEGTLDGNGNPASYLFTGCPSHLVANNVFSLDFSMQKKMMIGKRFNWRIISSTSKPISAGINMTFDYWVAYDVLYFAMDYRHQLIEPQPKIDVTCKSFDVTYKTLKQLSKLTLTTGKFEYTDSELIFYAYPTSSIIVAANAVKITDNNQIIAVREIPSNIKVTIKNVENAYVTYSDTIPEEELADNSVGVKKAKILSSSEKIQVSFDAKSGSKLFITGDYWPQTSAPVCVTSPNGCELHQGSFASIEFTQGSKVTADFNTLAKIPDFSFLSKADLKVNTLGMVSKVAVGTDKMFVQSGEYKVEIPIKSLKGGIEIYNSKSSKPLTVEVITESDGTAPSIPPGIKVTGDEGTKFIIDSSLNNSNIIDLPSGSDVDYQNINNVITKPPVNDQEGSGNNPSGGGSNTGAIVGGVIAAIVVVAIVIGVVIFLKKKGNKNLSSSDSRTNAKAEDNL